VSQLERKPALLPRQVGEVLGDVLRRPRVIPTRWNGVLYRSRTEARWAVFFDKLGAQAQYEAEGYPLATGWYLPDFWLPDWHIFVEVKGDTPEPHEQDKCAALAHHTRRPVLLVVGDPGLRRGEAYFPNEFDDGWADPLGNAFFACCRKCGVPVIAYQHHAGDYHGQHALASCGRPESCSEKTADFGRAMEVAINAARDERFSRKKETLGA